MEEIRIAVIGAGIAGLACAHELSRSDVAVTVFERARGLGGRLATRRQGEFAFDHGAQFVTARGRTFARYAEAAVRAGVIDVWKPRIMEDQRRWDAPIEDWWIGTPGMNALVRPLARNLTIHMGLSVHEVLRGQRGWELQTDSGRRSEVFRAIGLALPAPQAAGLLGPYGGTFRHLVDVRMAPCWTAMYAFDPALDLGFDARRWTTGPLVWAACNSTKAGRFTRPQCWVLHASSTWSRASIGRDPDDVARVLLNAFEDALGHGLPTPVYASAYRWRHALVEQPLGLPCLIDEEMSAGACGDWCIAPRVEAAFESGRSLAHSLLSLAGLSARVSRV